MEKKETVAAPELSGEEYHLQALNANESGEFLKALELTDSSIIAYHKEGNLPKSAEIRALRGLILRRLYKETSDLTFLVDAKHTLMAAVEISRSQQGAASLSIPLFELGKVQVEMNDLEMAISSYQEALDTLPQSSSNRISVEANIRANLETTKLLQGDESAHERALESITAISESTDATEHEKNVWEATGYMRLASALYNKDSTKAQEYLAKASEIIEKDPEDLKLIKGDLESLTSQLSS